MHVFQEHLKTSCVSKTKEDKYLWWSLELCSTCSRIRWMVDEGNLSFIFLAPSISEPLWSVQSLSLAPFTTNTSNPKIRRLQWQKCCNKTCWTQAAPSGMFGLPGYKIAPRQPRWSIHILLRYIYIYTQHILLRWNHKADKIRDRRRQFSLHHSL